MAKGKIFASAPDVFSKNGYAGINIRELAEPPGLAKSSMYESIFATEPFEYRGYTNHNLTQAKPQTIISSAV